MQQDIWILGATGRTGRGIALDLDRRGLPVVLLGRDRARLVAVAASLGQEPRIVTGTFAEQLAAIGEGRTSGDQDDDRPSIVVNTVGPFTTTALQVARALPTGWGYLDLSNEYPAVDDVLRLDRTAARAGQSLLPGAGFGVTATESLVVHLTAGRSRPERVHVDAIASLASEAGTLGTALAESIAAVAAFGGGSVRSGRFVRSMSTVSGTQTITTPDGDTVTTASGASAELRAAWLASDADEVTAGSMLAPTSPWIRPVLPVLTGLFRVPPIRRLAVSRIARVRMREQPMARTHSWAHARVEWSSGEVRRAWIRLGDAEEYTIAMAAEVAARLSRGEGTPGASTPATMFGAGLAESVGAVYIDEATTKGTR
ncbi:hypothetical protein [Curtobacterium sp. RRHDQ10]|uniref:hypothetical protein n=1 Tax=Curtobacterium phyllosphaerae TaxID=3413379 RepID=UPI003BEFB171